MTDQTPRWLFVEQAHALEVRPRPCESVLHLGHRPVVVKHALDLGRDVLAIDYGGVKFRDGGGTPEGDDSLKSRPEENW